jgi:hypothetical protein
VDICNITEGNLEMIFADLVDKYAVALIRASMMLAVLDVVVENVPELTALDLSDNKLYVLDSLRVLAAKSQGPTHWKKSGKLVIIAVSFFSLLHSCLCFMLKCCKANTC